MAQEFEAREYVDHAIAVVRDNSLNSRAVDWDAVTHEVHRLAAEAEAPIDTYPAIGYLLGQLNDGHSSLVPAPDVFEEYIIYAA